MISSPRPLLKFLRDAVQGIELEGSLYLNERTYTAATLAVIADYSERLNARGLAGAAVDAGFPIEGLDSDTIKGVVEIARRFEPDPSDQLLLESFSYYHRFDAFLPRPGAPDPPPPEVAMRIADRKFYDLLGDDRADVPCKRPDCCRGAISQSLLCRRHHFESIRGRPCPFND